MSVTLHTTLGDIKIQLHCQQVPRPAANFLALCASSVYDRSPFHRVIPDFIIQSGNAAETGKPSRAAFAKRLADQIHPQLNFDKPGVVAFANSGTPSHKGVGTQFFISVPKQVPHLNQTCTIIGSVIHGMDVVRDISALPCTNSRPNDDVYIQSVSIHANPFADVANAAFQFFHDAHLSIELRGANVYAIPTQPDMFISQFPSRRLWRYVLLVLSIMTWIGVLVWVIFGLNGLGSKQNKLFNWHPFIMTTAAVLFLPHAALTWSDGGSQDESEKTGTKWTHAVLTLLSFVLINIGVSVAYVSKKQQGFANFYSLHSWVGIITIGLLKGNLFGGFVSWAFPGSVVTSFSKGYHRNAGMVALLGANVTVMLGLMEQQSFINQRAESVVNGAAMGANLLGIMTFIVVTLTVGLVLSRRRPSHNSTIMVSGKNIEQELAAQKLAYAQRM